MKKKTENFKIEDWKFKKENMKTEEEEFWKGKYGNERTLEFRKGKGKWNARYVILRYNFFSFRVLNHI